MTERFINREGEYALKREALGVSANQREDRLRALLNEMKGNATIIIYQTPWVSDDLFKRLTPFGGLLHETP